MKNINKEITLEINNVQAFLLVHALPEIKLVKGDVTALKTERGCGGFGSTGR